MNSPFPFAERPQAVQLACDSEPQICVKSQDTWPRSRLAEIFDRVLVFAGDQFARMTDKERYSLKQKRRAQRLRSISGLLRPSAGVNRGRPRVAQARNHAWREFLVHKLEKTADKRQRPLCVRREWVSSLGADRRCYNEADSLYGSIVALNAGGEPRSRPADKPVCRRTGAGQ